ncbi:hypothetical protein TEA_021154 [Camellia sinensis var. sinensis]|uniref:Uncharacterized protein n=1 Tax=Camellia sinensis var. sinensis TaxID=542762 RepID=A0A4S4DHP8_CAMSN|nr:hypothetical protein TEA_021154 [Camellia sinensis var. sinensis]
MRSTILATSGVPVSQIIGSSSIGSSRYPISKETFVNESQYPNYQHGVSHESPVMGENDQEWYDEPPMGDGDDFYDQLSLTCVRCFCNKPFSLPLLSSSNCATCATPDASVAIHPSFLLKSCAIKRFKEFNFIVALSKKYKRRDGSIDEQLNGESTQNLLPVQRVLRVR